MRSMLMSPQLAWVIHFKTPAGLSRSLPVEASVVEEPRKDEKAADQDPAAAKKVEEIINKGWDQLWR